MNTPARVLMTADAIGGVWTYALELMRALPDIEFALATMGKPLTNAQRCDLEQLSNVRLFDSNYRLEWMDECWRDVDQAGEWLLRIAAEFRPDIVHLNGYGHAALPWSAPVLIVAHSCVLSWWRAVKNEPAPERFAEYQTRVSAGLAAAEIVVAPSQAMLDTLSENYAFTGRGRVIANARAPHLFAPGEKQPVIFAAGRIWDEAKNIEALHAVAANVRWPIKVAGEGTGFPNVEMLRTLSTEQMREQFAASAIYAFPARYEPFGLSILEAALAGCALVLGDISSLREIWKDDALFVAPNDHEQLAVTLNQLIENAELLESLGRRARTRALQFSPEKMVASYRAVYRELLVTTNTEVAA